MNLDGRFEPLQCLAQAAALIAVLVGWWRHDRKRTSAADSGPGQHRI